jgi:hypothetical protein
MGKPRLAATSRTDAWRRVLGCRVDHREGVVSRARETRSSRARTQCSAVILIWMLIVGLCCALLTGR